MFVSQTLQIASPDYLTTDDQVPPKKTPLKKHFFQALKFVSLFFVLAKLGIVISTWALYQQIFEFLLPDLSIFWGYFRNFNLILFLLFEFFEKVLEILFLGNHLFLILLDSS